MAGDPEILVKAASVDMPEVEKVIVEAKANLLKTAAAKSDWQAAGVDPVAFIAAAPGGVDATVLFEDGDTPTISYLGTRDVPLPPGLSEAVVAPLPAVTGEARMVTIVRMSDNIWVKSFWTYRREGSALCDQGNSSLSLLSDKSRPFSDIDMIAGVVTVKLLGLMRTLKPCSVFVRSGAGLVDRAYLPDGRELVAMNKDAGASVLRPLTEAAALLSRPAKLADEAAKPR